MQDPVALLKDDHVKVKGLFAEYFKLASAQPERKRALAEEILRELLVHERIEEEIFYPAFRRAAGELGEEEVQHAKEEHLLVDSLVNQLTELDLDDPKFDATFLVLRENVEHHIKDEEEKMLPAAPKYISASKLQSLGDSMFQYKEELTEQLRSGPDRGARTPRQGAQDRRSA